MNNYTFSTLNDKEFEQIVKDLLNVKYNLNLQDYKVGKDKGIDLRYSKPKNNNAIVVQAKHYVGSSYSQLKHTLIKKELDKIKKLNPDRYIVVTSLPLNASQQDELKDILAPYVLSSNDIIGQEALNGYLAEYPNIEKRYFKLWFSSINVFNAIISNAIEGRTKYLLEKIKEKVKFYVVTTKLGKAKSILNKEKILLITGQPGIGKTTLAEILLFDRAREGCKVFKVETIREAEDIISVDENEKQVFYFDDFLGANYDEIVNAQKTESQLTSFVDRIRNSRNKYLILTTRTVILNQAIEKYEKIANSRFSNEQFEIKLTDYNQYEKALILYNHLYFKKLNYRLLNAITNEKFYKKIIHHKNYTPRIIEFITDDWKIAKLTSTEYIQFILTNLNNPKDIWRHSFNKQIEYFDRCLLLTLFTFENIPTEINLIDTFNTRLNYEKIEHNHIIDSNQFNNSVKILLNGFISSTLVKRDKSVRYYNFINPSLIDFLIGYVSDSYNERKNIISSISYVEQLSRFNPVKSIIPLEKELQLIIYNRIDNLQITMGVVPI
jgi:DNA polymerase III delta prime subunit